MRKMVYIDNLFIRRLVLVDKHYTKDQRDRLVKFYKETFGISREIIKCPYLFLEFLGCTKNKLGISAPIPIHISNRLTIGKLNEHDMKLIDSELKKSLEAIFINIKNQLACHKNTLQSRLQTTQNLVYADTFSKNIIDAAFGNYIDLLNNNLSNFSEIFVNALAWDVFSTIQPAQPNLLGIIRQRQLGMWLKNSNPDYPFGKIIDDLSEYYSHKFPVKNFYLGASDDMVDSKMMTLPITGYVHQETIRQVDVITFDTNTIAERAKLALGSIKNIEESLCISIPKKSGNIYCIFEKQDPNNPIHVEIIQNQYPILL